MEEMEPTRVEDQARAMAATRRIMAREKLELLGDEDALPGVFTEEDRDLLAGDEEELQQEDLRTFSAWHAARGTDPDTAFEELRQRLYDRVMGQLPDI